MPSTEDQATTMVAVHEVKTYKGARDWWMSHIEHVGTPWLLLGPMGVWYEGVPVANLA